METGQAIADREAQRQREREKSARDHEGAMAEIGRENLEKHRELDDEYQRRIAENEPDLARARNECQDALAEARQNRAEREGEKPEAIEGPEDLLAKARASLSGLGDLLETARERTIDVIGTFNASALLGLQAGRVNRLRPRPPPAEGALRAPLRRVRRVAGHRRGVLPADRRVPRLHGAAARRPDVGAVARPLARGRPRHAVPNVRALCRRQTRGA